MVEKILEIRELIHALPGPSQVLILIVLAAIMLSVGILVHVLVTGWRE